MELNLLTLAEVRERFLPMVPLSTLRKWVHDGRLPSYKLGRRRCISEADLQAFLEARRTEAA